MNKKYFTALFAAVAFVTLAGCASPTVITLKDGSQIQTKNKPKYDRNSGFYEFEQRDGKPVRINKDDIHTIKKK
ncbi:YgdI/YgdR family lipoprotein [Pseudomonas sp. C27(2019)]|uniref:YgdI/YgdR family lipoprotein n=1 Tax=Pseudomonas sp. C27(2019) TaxID=2604941 RepID=UPI0012457541|nr:YgdI/YgdR family lipoprotein [Pseudomonas sp. C27(2019)]QEY59111.1 YgdI/YgdR family lipoprotein [Pseudomonas sp. C27(2019)]